MSDVILVINAGSSSVKISIFDLVNKKIGKLLHHIFLEKEEEEIILHIDNTEIAELFPSSPSNGDLISLMIDTFESWWKNQEGMNLIATGHRVVHGGPIFTNSVKVTDIVQKQLESLIPLAPLHQPYNIKALQMYRQQYPDKIHVACFDTAFHSFQTKLSKSYALPNNFFEEGVYKYGFHGLSYKYITQTMRNLCKEGFPEKMIIAHLGNGASMCAVKNGISIATSMGFTAIDGLMMGTRCGAIDPGVILYLLTHGKMTVEEVSTLLYRKSGLLGVSGESYDVRELQKSKSEESKFALELFVYRAQLEIGRLTSALGGLDILVFTAGIGENSAEIRENITANLGWLGVKLDPELNKNYKHSESNYISSEDSRVKILALPTDEERVIAEDVANLL